MVLRWLAIPGRAVGLRTRCRALLGVTYADAARVATHEGSDDVQSQAGAGFLTFQFLPESHEAAEDLAAQVRGDAAAVVGNPHGHVPPADGLQTHLDPRRRAGIFHRVVDQIAKDDVEVDPPAGDDARPQVETHRLDRHTITHAHRRRAVASSSPNSTSSSSPRGLAIEPAGVEHLVDQVVEPLQVFEHETVEIDLQLLAHLMAIERLQVSFIDAMGDFNSCVTLSMKFDCRRVRLMALIERIR